MIALRELYTANLTSLPECLEKIRWWDMRQKCQARRLVREVNFCPILCAKAVDEMPVVFMGRNGGTCRTQKDRDCLFVCRYLRAALYLL